MAMKVSISFKPKEKNMYEYLAKQLSPSIYIKVLIQHEMEREQKEKQNCNNGNT